MTVFRGDEPPTTEPGFFVVCVVALFILSTFVAAAYGVVALVELVRSLF